MEYNFEKLNDKEFEILVSDLISKEKNVRIERFKPGRDGGVDGRFFSSPNEEVILQCKHYLKSGLNKLLSVLKKEELPKVQKLNPSQYFFITSLPLSRENKKKIKELFHPYIKNDNDIYGSEDLNTLLDEYPNVEEKHYKLWITSTSILKRILNNAIKGRSEFLLEQFKEDSFLYIHTNNHNKALNHLKQNNVLILTGEPGVGKTTLSNNLSLFFVANDYEFVAIEESISEAEEVYSRDKKQIFYYDDFLGSNFLEAIQNKKDSHIMNFIERILRDKSKIFILTSRTTIINNGLHFSPIFENKKLGNKQFLLTIDSLTKYDKALILYNHIWYSQLSEDYINIFYKNKNYMKIINHKYFNPRLIEFITDIERVDTTPENFWKHIKYKLDNPDELWENYFKVQNNIYIRILVYIIIFNGGKIDENNLRHAYNSLCNLKKIDQSKTVEYDYLTITKLAVNSLVKTTNQYGSIEYQVLNPSISDYVIKSLKDNYIELKNIFLSIKTTSSLSYLISLNKNDYLTDKEYKSILIGSLDIIDFEDSDINYLINLVFYHYQTNIHNHKTSIYLKELIQRDDYVREIYKLLLLINTHIFDLEELSIDIIYSLLGSSELKDYEITELTEIFKSLNIKDEEQIEEFKEYRRERIDEYMEQALDDAINSIDIGTFMDGYDYNHTAIASKIEDEMNDLLFSVIDDDFEDDEDIDINDYINSQVDISNLIEDYEQTFCRDSDNEYFDEVKSEIFDIEDLFEKHI